MYPPAPAGEDLSGAAGCFQSRWNPLRDSFFSPPDPVVSATARLRPPATRLDPSGITAARGQPPSASTLIRFTPHTRFSLAQNRHPPYLSLVPLKKLFQLLFAVFASIHLVGGPYALVQTYAWAGMLVSYSKEDGLLQGAKETFSGEKPCALCCKIAEAKKADSDHGKSNDLPASPLALAPPRFTDAPQAMFPGMIPPVETNASAPPVPPPRQAA